MTAPPVVAGLDYSTRAIDVAVLCGRQLLRATSYDLGRDPRSHVAVIAYGDGSGDGYGYGDGSGDGYGSGDGSGYGEG